MIFWEISEPQKTNIWEKTCAEQSVRLVSSDLKELVYGIDIFQKPRKANLGNLQVNERNLNT